MKKLITVLSLAALSSVVLTGCSMWAQPNNRSQMHATNYQQQKMQSNQPMTDSAITANVKSKFMSQDVFTSKDVASMSIHVKTVNGVVYLTGKADNRTQVNNAIKIAQSVDGVKNVVSKVMVRHA